MLNVTNLTFSYGRRRRPVLTDFNLKIEHGGIYGLLGKNGAGKSTLLNLMSGLLTPDSGCVTLDGVNTRLRRPSTLQQMFLIPEEFDLPAIPLIKFVELNAGFYPNFSVEDLRRHLKTMDMDYDLNLGQLSMGQKKKAYMCFALACNTPVLLMDEPTNGLDIPSKSSFRRFIVSCCDDNRIILISTHQVRDIDKVLDHVIIMDNNHVILDNSVDEITRRLNFSVTDDETLAASALYSRKALGGYDIITEAAGDDEAGDINLETLFDFALRNDGSLDSIFINKEGGYNE